jgi:hypothetical protein
VTIHPSVLPGPVLLGPVLPGPPFSRWRFNDEYWEDFLRFPISCRSIPATAHLNYEARQVTLQHYILMTGDPPTVIHRDTTAYFNPALDILSIVYWLPNLLHTRAFPPKKHTERFLNNAALAERIVVGDKKQFNRLVGDLMADNKVLFRRFSALRSVEVRDRFTQQMLDSAVIRSVQNQPKSASQFGRRRTPY